MNANNNEDSSALEFTLSFAKENRDLYRNQQRLNIQILRVHTIQKQRFLHSIWKLQQQQLCDFFTNYHLFPQPNFNLQDILSHADLKLVKNNGKIYFGTVKNKKREGKGINISQEGKIYQGEFYGNEKNGSGIQIYANGNLYIGQFMNGKKHGEGKFYWFALSSRNPKADQYVEFYEGQWWGGLPDGFGVHQKINGDLYTGIFKNGLKHGEGTELYGNGDHYKGQFVNGMSQGYGEYTWKDGSTFKGDFKQGVINGYGLWQANKNRIESYRGHYIMDKKSGYGEYTWDNGWCYKGNFEDDKRNGYGELYRSDNSLNYRGFWQNGEQVQKQSGVVTSKERSRSKQRNYKNIQLNRSNNKKQTITQVFAIRKEAVSARKTNQSKDYATISNLRDFNLAKRRPMSTTSGKKFKMGSGNELNSSSKFASTKAHSHSSKSKIFIGTIKSNLFVPAHHPTRA